MCTAVPHHPCCTSAWQCMLVLESWMACREMQGSTSAPFWQELLWQHCTSHLHILTTVRTTASSVSVQQSRAELSLDLVTNRADLSSLIDWSSEFNIQLLLLMA